MVLRGSLLSELSQLAEPDEDADQAAVFGLDDHQPVAVVVEDHAGVAEKQGRTLSRERKGCERGVGLHVLRHFHKRPRHLDFLLDHDGLQDFHSAGQRRTLVAARLAAVVANFVLLFTMTL